MGTEGKEHINWQYVSVEKSIKLGNKLNVGGKNNKGSNMGVFFFLLWTVVLMMSVAERKDTEKEIASERLINSNQDMWASRAIKTSNVEAGLTSGNYSC